MLMNQLKLHLKTSILASLVAMIALLSAFFVASGNFANQVQTEQKQLAKLQAENLAEHLSRFPEQIDADDLQRLTNFVSESRPNFMTVRVWKLVNNKFIEDTVADDSLPFSEMSDETQNALITGLEIESANITNTNVEGSLFRIFAPITKAGKVIGAVEAVERLDTVATISLRYANNFLWIVLATILLMALAFYLLFQSLVYRPLDRILIAMRKTETGNLDAEIIGNTKDNEFGKLSRRFNSMMSQIREMTFEREKQTEILQEKIHEATAELMQKNEQLENANLELFRTTRKMSEFERLAAAGQTASEFAHEVGTPLNLISGHIQLLQTKFSVDSKESNRLQTINSQIERIENIVRQMLDRTRFGVSEHKSLDINNLIRKLSDVIEPTLDANNVELKTDLADELPLISGDSERLQQVFLNLLNNALDAMQKGGKLNISTFVDVKKVAVKFSDNGIGMTEDVRTRIFQPLFTTKERGRGTGLGLVVVKQILSEHNAEIIVESKVNKGTSFKIIFETVEN
jgi:two-component system, NtrC family, sensor kinase